ncbi:MAG: sigma-70 family RNA polymerase sigma factor [Bacteroidota bacterium]
MTASPASWTALLVAARGGDDGARHDLFPMVYDELRRIAHHRLRQHRPGDTLNTTALVHEAYLRMIDQTQVAWKDRGHFLAMASRAMRFILVDYARAAQAQKRGGNAPHVSLDRVQVGQADHTADLLTVNTALEHLMRYDKRLGQIVEYRFFGGLTYEEIATARDCSIPTAKRDWQRARTWLYRLMQDVR